MPYVKLYNNKPYPYFIKNDELNSRYESENTNTFYVNEFDILNINKTSKGGTFTFMPENGTKYDLYDVNYVKITKYEDTGGNTSTDVYGWIEEWTHERNGSFKVNYKVDPLRTFKYSIDFGEQFVTRIDTERLSGDGEYPEMRDPMVVTYGLPVEDYTTENASPNFDGANTRYVVIQVRPRSYVGGVDISDPVEPSNNALNPSQYRLYVGEYKINNPLGSNFALRTLLSELRDMAETSNIVTMYSVPFINGYSSLSNEDLIVRVGDKEALTITGFKAIGEYDDIMELQTYNFSIDVPTGVDYLYGDTVQIITPEGQVLNVPPTILNNPFAGKGKIPIERIVDLYSGSVTTHIGHNFLTPYSVRSGPLGEITILSDPKETYKAQNKNSITVGLLGDVAAVGGILAAPVTGGMSLAATAGALGNTAEGIAGKTAGMMDSGNTYSNQPLFLGETIGAKYNNVFHVFYTIHKRELPGNVYGKPYEGMLRIDSLIDGWDYKGETVQPEYLQTHNAKVTGHAPLWALEEVNNLLDNGLLLGK